MIKIGELRIGNYLHDRENRLCKVESISIGLKDSVVGEAFKAHAIVGGLTSLPHKTIPLTEEILLKCGFERYEFDNGQYRFKNRLIVIRDGKFVDYGSDVIITSLHQLQNLYFSLTGEELTINL